MKKTILTVLLSLIFLPTAFGAGVGYIEYSKVVNSYSLSLTYQKNLKTKFDSIQKYVKNQEDKIKKATTKEEKQRLQKITSTQIEKMQKEYITQKTSYEQDVNTKIKNASEKVRMTKGFDVIVKSELMVTGGINCTQMVINELKK